MNSEHNADNNAGAVVVAVARQWIGTPYQHQASCYQVGCDCLGLLRGVWRTLCGREPGRIAPYSRDWGEALGQERLLVAARAYLDERWTPSAGQPLAFEAGDVLLFRMQPGALAKHVAIAASDTRMVHAQEGVPVSEVVIGDWWRRRIVGVFGFPCRAG